MWPFKKIRPEVSAICWLIERDHDGWHVNNNDRDDWYCHPGTGIGLGMTGSSIFVYLGQTAIDRSCAGSYTLQVSNPNETRKIKAALRTLDKPKQNEPGITATVFRWAITHGHMKEAAEAAPKANWLQRLWVTEGNGPS